jgi:hypothetical protein
MQQLLIAIPIKNKNEDRDYQARAVACKETWLKDCPCDYRFFTDEDLGLDPQRQRFDQCEQSEWLNTLWRVATIMYSVQIPTLIVGSIVYWQADSRTMIIKVGVSTTRSECAPIYFSG